MIKAITKDSEYREYQAGTRGKPEWTLSRSDLWDFHFCPEAFLNGPRHVNRESPGIKKGSLLDVLILKPEWFDQMFAIIPGWEIKTGANKGKMSEALRGKEPLAWKAEVEKEGKTVVKKGGSEGLEAMQLAANRILNCELPGHLTLKKLLASDSVQTQQMVTAGYTDEETGILVHCKALVDIDPGETMPSALMDLKGAAWPDPSKFEWDAKKYGLDFQAGFYCLVYEWATGDPKTRFYWPVIGNDRPWLPAFYKLVGDKLQEAKDRVLNTLRNYCRCVATNKWPGLTDGWQALGDKWS